MYMTSLFQIQATHYKSSQWIPKLMSFSWETPQPSARDSGTHLWRKNEVLPHDVDEVVGCINIINLWYYMYYMNAKKYNLLVLSIVSTIWNHMDTFHIN